MIKTFSKTIFFLGFILLEQVCFTQELSNKIFEAKVFSSEEGLSSSRITVNFVDSRGYLWIGTMDGLNRYDGYEFIIFKHEPGDSLSISNNQIRCIEEDSNGNLFVGTNNGLNIFDRIQGHFEEFVFNYPDEEINKCKRIDNIIVSDSSGLWVQIENSLKRINLKDHSIRSSHFYEADCSSDNEYSTSGLIIDANGFIWLGTNEGLFVMNNTNETYEQFVYNSRDPYSLSDNNVNDIFRDVNDEIWIATDNGLNKFDPLNKHFLRFTNKNSENYTNFQVTKIVETENKDLWMATSEGLARLNKNSRSINLYPQISINKNLVGLSSLKSLVIDQNNIMWTGGETGLIKIDLKPRRFDQTIHNSEANLNLNESNITAIYKDNKGRIWVGNNEGSLVLNDIKKDKTSNFSLGNKLAKTIFEDSKGRIWIGSSKGIFLYSEDQDQLIAFEDFFTAKVGSDLSRLSVFQIIQGRKEDFWIGTNNGLYHFKENIKTVDSYNKIYNDQISVNVGSVYALWSDKVSELWIGTQHGVFVFNPLSNVFYKPDLGFENGSNLEDFSVYSILLDRDNVWWIGTNYGLLYINSSEGIRNHYTEKNGLPNNSVFKLLEDTESNIWFSTNKGLVKYDKSRKEFLSYGLNDGLNSFEYNPCCGSSSFDGELFFGGLRGIDRFYPHQLVDDNNSPQILITQLEVYGQNVIKRQLIDKDTPLVKVRYNETFNLHFSVMDYSNPEQNRFMYSISSEEKRVEWLPIGTQKSLTFSNLPSGTYTFRLKGSSGGRIWSENEASLKIIVEAPFWKTRIALFVYGTVILLLFSLFIRVRTSTLRKSNLILRENEIVANEVSQQKELLSYRNKNIEDSLNYAQRIQRAILVSQEKFNQILPNSFVLYLPKDIVSGDFYWISEKENKVFVAAIDCTGHGVPGAFVSLIGLELLRKITSIPGLVDPAIILDNLNDNIQDIFGKDGTISLRDGMDLAFCVIDKKEMILQYSGAMNPLYMIRNDKLIEIKGDRFSIGADIITDAANLKKFTSQIIKLEKNDMIYMFSDGFADQFGGPAGKKYKYRRFRHLLLTIYNTDITRQKHYLEESIEDWRGNEEQVDDVLVIGIKADFNTD